MSPAPVCGMSCSPTRMMPRLLCYSATVLHTSASVLQQVRRGLHTLCGEGRINSSEDSLVKLVPSGTAPRRSCTVPSRRRMRSW
jgi:hypothetical protein